ncbi:MAG TPA: two-component system sensor histidine kinase CreC [Opitutaceae bacterium]|nr:two-component system sensor histidine kinase CreC [Opitutaceae bacterium]
MSLRLRLLILLLAIYTAGGVFLTRWVLNQVRPRYLESMEESLVDTSVLLAGVLESQMNAGGLNGDSLRRTFAAARAHALEARIFSLRKSALDLQVYVTDEKGRVVFDSAGQDEGKDFSRWNDVARTLRGQYGARSTRNRAGDDESQVIHVAAPVRQDGRIVGVVSVGKPTHGINALVAVAKRRILVGAALGGVGLLLVLLVVTSWVVAPLERLTAYARAVRDGRPAPLPPLPGRTLRELGTAFEEMRDALEGRQHAARYTQALAHEVKAPLAAIRGAAELLGEDMAAEQRGKFLGNIRSEAARIQQIVDRLLELSSLEARKALGQTERLEAAALLADAGAAVRPAFEAAGVALAVEGGAGVWLRGERVLLREALVNLLQNALEFTPAGGRVAARAERAVDRVEFAVEDNGTGVPDYALARVFERFYSLPRPGSGRKSTGLGLALVREIAHLHGGETALANRAEGGARATLWVPRDPGA